MMAETNQNGETRSKTASLFAAWTKRYLLECKRHKPDSYVYDVDGKPNKHIVRGQIDFMRKYIDCMLLDGDSGQNLSRIEYFLSMQGALNEEERMEIRFCCGNPVEAYVFVDTLDDVDIEDVLSISGFEKIIAYRENSRKWTKKTAETFVRALKDDLGNDGNEVALDYSIAEDCLEIEIAPL